MPFTVGLTGGLASGKSSVDRLLVAAGVAVLDADQVVHSLYEVGGDGARAVVELFGDGVLDPDGGVDRQALGELVLGDDEALAALNAAIHPLVWSWVHDWLESLDAEVAVIDAALMIESGSAARYDALVVVWCRPEQQLERAIGRGMERGRAEAILAAQLPLEAKRERADEVIDNSGRPEDLAGEVDRVWQRVLERARRSR